MASLYQLGLINGFFGGVDKHANPFKERTPPDVSANLLRVDLTGETAMDSLCTATDALADMLRAGTVTDSGMVKLSAVAESWTEVKRSGGEGAAVEPSWFAVHTVLHSVSRMNATLWCEHPHLHCVFPLVGAEIQAPESSVTGGAEEWHAVGGTLDFYSAGLDRLNAVVRDDLRDELVFLVRIAYVLQTLDLYDMLVATRRPNQSLSYAEKRHVGQRINPGLRKQLLNSTVVREVDVRLSETRATEEAARANEWVEFDPLAERRAAGTLPYTPRRQHEVGGFTRFLKKSGKVVPVRPHVRGNPLLGVVKRMKNVVIEP